MSVPDKPKPGELVVLRSVPPGLLDGLPQEDQNAIVNDTFEEQTGWTGQDVIARELRGEPSQSDARQPPVNSTHLHVINCRSASH
jgi:hypothetical protein